MVRFSYIEDYIQFIAGTRDVNNKTSLTWLSTAAVSLARYDKNVINSFAEQIEQQTGFTDRQSLLAIKLVEKYRRQMAKLSVALPDDIASVPFRFGIRQVDRTRRLYIKGEVLVLQFPYNAELINTIKEYAKESQGSVSYVSDAKYWSVAATEGCVNWAVAFAKAFDFKIDDDVMAMFNLILEAEAVPYAIELCRLDGALTITNAASSLLDYINKHIGDITEQNLNRLIDMASVLGYTVSPEIMMQAKSAKFLHKRNVQIKPAPGALSDIVEYARTYNKFPIISYSPSGLDAGAATELESYFDPDEVLHLNTIRGYSVDDITDNHKLIHMRTKAAKLYAGRSPLVICYGNMNFGLVNSLVLQQAERVVYYCNPIITP